MNTVFRKRIVSTAVAGVLATGLGLAATTGTAQALQKGDWLARVGASMVEPNESSSNPGGGLAPGTSVSINSNTQLSFTVAYMYTNNISFEVLGATPFSHDISGSGGSLAGAGKVAEIKHLPPTFSVNWHFQPQSNVRPYVGAGVNYTYFYDEKTTGAASGLSMSLDNSWGPAVQAGVDYDINKKWFVNANVRYIKISTTAKFSNGYSLDVDVDPMVYTLAVGTHF